MDDKRRKSAIGRLELEFIFRQLLLRGCISTTEYQLMLKKI